MQRAFYSNGAGTFARQKPDEILGMLAKNNIFALEQNQRNAWQFQIMLLQKALQAFPSGSIAFEYTIPRIGDRIDNILSVNGILYILEFKVGERFYPKYAIDQVVDYALDLKYFHQESNNRKIVPMIICTHADDHQNAIAMYEDEIYKPILCNQNTLKENLEWLVSCLSDMPIAFDQWINSAYMPTPTIIEAAQALYRGHDVKEISRSDSEAYNLSLTSEAISQIIDDSKKNHEKSICFITGVPGAGKTLAGLNIANSRHNFEEDEHAVFLSGNGPLVYVLREALARDEYERSNHAVRKSMAAKKAEAFIQNIHHFRDAAVTSPDAPVEKVVVFDEAQRAWTKEQTASFMTKRGAIEWNASEPEFLISVMDRHKDWAVIICLVGGGQEINTGEAGLPAWFEALRDCYPNWRVYISRQITDEEYTRGAQLKQLLYGLNYEVIDRLHLAVSLRSFRCEKVSTFVKALLDIDMQTAKNTYVELQEKYPIRLTRNLETAKKWVQSKARGTERYGLMASSEAKRLRSFGIWVQNDITAENWFLNSLNDVRSSYYLEETATEFHIQGLEIDWSVVAWDADLRIERNAFVPYSFRGTDWSSINNQDDRLYRKNAYRVLLTRARQGFIIFIPEGETNDRTRKHEYYDNTYNYLKEIGIVEI